MNMYILDDNDDPIPCADAVRWGKWFENNAEGVRRVGADDVGHYWVSTVFLGIDHRFGTDGPPLLYETMVFNHGPERVGLEKWHDEMCERYSTRAEALAGHKAAVESVRLRLRNAEEMKDG